MEQERECSELHLPAWAASLRTADPLMITDADQTVLYWSDEAARLLDFDRREVLGRPCYEILCGRDPVGAAICVRNCVVALDARYGRASPSFEVVTTRRDGRQLALDIAVLTVGADAESPALLIHLLRESHRSALAARNAALPAGRQAGEHHSLSRRETEVLNLLVEGYSAVEIAAELHLSRLTVRNHLTNMQCKLGARNRVELLLCAVKAGII